MPTGSPFISGCYIVKDEAEMLPASLAAIGPFVDEVVVYDTGSTDGTRELASELGARVVEGYWDDDFGAARNRALEHCRGEWVMVVDADEIVQGDARRWRREVRLATCDAFSVEIRSGSWGAVGRSAAFRATRAFRRSLGRYEGALHEQVVGRWGDIDRARTDAVVLEHHGYSPTRIVERNKGARNLAIASAALEKARRDGVQELDSHYVDVGRSALGAGDHRKALDVFAQIDRDTVDRALAFQAAHPAVFCAIRIGDLDVGHEWLAFLRTAGEGEQICRTIEGRLLMAAGDYDRAASLLETITDDVNFEGIAVSRSGAVDDLVQCLWAQEKFQDALDVLIPHVAGGQSTLEAGFVVAVAHSVPGGLDLLARAVPEDLVKSFVGQIAAEYSLLGEAFLDAMWCAERNPTLVLAAISRYGAGLPVERAVTWSVRLRESGLAEHCPLRLIFADDERPLTDRVVSGAVLFELGDRDCLTELSDLVAAVPDDVSAPLLDVLHSVAPQFASMVSADA
ncbi:glycosyltransferase family 2 protein [Kineococcus sp. GCM10028916]|uniref:glycosyltransferase family 2 protein n=1 Tax=Kineococcus sp. GCM10028916 TaxID=3273394 RepID=UPI0036274E61